jgi:excisionase family DNA binding protein
MTRDRVLTPDEFAREVKLPRKTVVMLCARGDIPGARKLGRCWRIPASAIDSLFDAQSPGGGGASSEAPRAEPSMALAAKRPPDRAAVLRSLKGSS